MKVSMRNGFSDRNGFKPENTEIQLTSFDTRTRTQLSNMISKLYGDVFRGSKRWENNVQEFFRYVLGDIYSEPVDVRKQYSDDEVFKIINNTILHDDFDDVLTLVEGIAQYLDGYLKDTMGSSYYSDHCGYRTTSIFGDINTYFEREYIGYRFVQGVITPISDRLEVETISKAISCKYEPVRKHLRKANEHLANRVNPDYENSIKESISAVEAICEIITGQSGREATLGSMLKKLESNGVAIHGGLKTAFNALYGYTSDANGIRHAGDIGGSASTFEEAKFMLVSCSAFINYLITLSA